MPPKTSNTLPLWGNQNSMNLNPLILTNIQSSPYFKNDLFKLKTYHEVIDEIYYKVAHLEPWERGSRQTSGQIGMCGGVRGVGAGGIVSSAYCLLFKLYTLKLTRKQLIGLLTHGDSPFIRGLGFLYIRYSQPPQDLWDWYEPYLEDEEEIETKAGGGNNMTIGQMLQNILTKLEWHSTLFPRIPVPVQKDIESKMAEWRMTHAQKQPEGEMDGQEDGQDGNDWNKDYRKADRFSEERPRSHDRDRERNRGSRDRDRDHNSSRERSRDGDRDRDRGGSGSRHHSRHSSRDRSDRGDRGDRGDRHRDRDRDRGGGKDDFELALHRERNRQERERGNGRDSRDRGHRRSRSRSRDRKRRSHSREKKRRSRSRSRDRHRRRSHSRERR